MSKHLRDRTVTEPIERELQESRLASKGSNDVARYLNLRMQNQIIEHNGVVPSDDQMSEDFERYIGRQSITP